MAPFIDNDSSYCGENTIVNYTGTVPATFMGALDADDSTYNRVVNTCATVSLTDVAYDTVTINNTTATTADFVVTSELDGGGACDLSNNTHFTLYSNVGFNPASPLNNCLAINDDISPSNLCSTLPFAIPAGETRTLVTAGVFGASATFGLFSYQINFAGTTLACGTEHVTNGNDSGSGSLRQAIADACAGDTITFASGVTTVTLTSAALLINKNLTIDGGLGVTVTRQGGSPNFRIFNILFGNTVLLNRLVNTNGNTNPGDGGGIRNRGTLTLVDSTVSGNSANGTTGSVAAGTLGIGGGISNFGTLMLERFDRRRWSR